MLASFAREGEINNNFSVNTNVCNRLSFAHWLRRTGPLASFRSPHSR